MLQEEMRRVLAYFDWKADWWRNQGGQRTNIDDPAISSGIKAYAEKRKNKGTQEAYIWPTLGVVQDIWPWWRRRYQCGES